MRSRNTRPSTPASHARASPCSGIAHRARADRAGPSRHAVRTMAFLASIRRVLPGNHAIQAMSATANADSARCAQFRRARRLVRADHRAPVMGGGASFFDGVELAVESAPERATHGMRSSSLGIFTKRTPSIVRRSSRCCQARWLEIRDSDHRSRELDQPRWSSRSGDHRVAQGRCRGAVVRPPVRRIASRSRSTPESRRSRPRSATGTAPSSPSGFVARKSGMAKYLATELPRLVKDVVRADGPRDQRVTSASRKRSATKSAAAKSRLRVRSSQGRA